jgi:uncharacterized protein YaaQ
MSTEKDPKMMLKVMATTCSLASGFLRSSVVYALKGDDAKMAEMLIRNLEEEIKLVQEYINDKSQYEENMQVYLDYAIALSSEIDWIFVPKDATATKADGGAYVETLVFVADSEIEEVFDENRSGK